MRISNFIFAVRYGIHLPESRYKSEIEFTSYSDNAFKLVANLQTDEDNFQKIGDSFDDICDRSKSYLNSNDLELLTVLMGKTSSALKYIIKFDSHGITLASTITICARDVSLIYIKYNKDNYDLQLSLTNKSSIKFAWSEVRLEGDFHFNLKRTLDYTTQEKTYKTSISGFTDFHLGNKSGSTPVTLSTGVFRRKSIDDSKGTDFSLNDYAQKYEKHSYVFLKSKLDNGLSVGDIIRMVTPSAVDVPDALDGIVIFDLVVIRSAKEREETKKDTSLAIIFDCHIMINGNRLKTKLTIISKSVIGDDKGVNKEFIFKGKVTAGEHKFNVVFQKEQQGGSEKEQGSTKSAWAILADYDSGKTKTTVDFRQMVSSLFSDVDRESLPDISLDINKFKAFFYYKKTADPKAKNKLLFGMGAGVAVDVGDIPVAGPVLVEVNAFKFNEVLALYASGEFTEKELKSIKALPQSKDKKKKLELGEGLMISAELEINGDKEVYLFGNKKKSKNTDAPTSTAVTSVTSEGESESVSTTISAKASWTKVDKKIGPVTIQRLGIAYSEGKVIVLIDSALSMKGLGMQLMGLGVGFNLDWSNLCPAFYLDGLGLTYSAGPVDVTGALMRSGNGYSGLAKIKLSKATISAIGSYTTVNDKSSLFVYGLLEGSIGGPPFFYVTAIAAGFGYNRKINAPPITGVADYPLVALAMQPEDLSLPEVLTKLDTKMSNDKLPIEVSVGDYWLAVGVRFTSFKIIESFLLLTANFGHTTEFNLLGLSRLSWPEKSIRNKIKLKDPIINVELAIKASYTVGGDVITVDGLISPNSYVLSKNCKLSGGFALYTWVKGAHKGDFVISIGGYHPRYKKPAHYPEVPRIALDWKMSDLISLHGELYFTLTPSCIMLGGLWRVIFQTDEVKASMAIWIDILLQWAPFYYDIGIGIMIGIEAHISLALITIHIDLELRAELRIWGPPFAGLAEVDLGIYSFEIAFGDKNPPNKELLEWDDFAGSFLPLAEESPKTYMAVGDNLVLDTADSSLELDCISIVVSEGVMRTYQDEHNTEIIIANPQQMAVSIDSNIPVQKFSLNNELSLSENDNQTSDPLGVKPCGYTSDEVTFDMLVTVTLNGKSVSNFDKESVQKSFPAALWSGAAANDKADNQGEELIKNVTSGVNLMAKEPTVNYSQSYDFSQFVSPLSLAKDVRIPDQLPPEKFDQDKVYSQMQDYQKSAIVRNELVAALSEINGEWDAIAEYTDMAGVGEYYEHAADHFRSTPKLCKLGHLLHNPKN